MANKKISKVNLSGESYEIDVATNLKATDILSTNKGQTSKVATVGAVQKPDGVNALFDENNKISSHYIGDIILGQLKFGGTLTSYNPSNEYTVNPSQLILSKLYELTNYPEGAAPIDSLQLSIVGDPSIVSITMISNGEVKNGYGDNDGTAFEGFYFISAANLSDEYAVGDWLVINNKNFEKIDNTDTITHIKDADTSLLSIEGAGLKLDKITKNNQQQVVIEGEALVGTPSGDNKDAIVNVDYLETHTISELYDTDVKLSAELKTYYSVGKVTASGTDPATIGNAGDSLRDVFNNLFNMEAVNPTTTAPSLSLSLSNNSSSIEYGSIVSFTATVTASPGRFNGAYYTANPSEATQTGVTWSTLNLVSTNSTFTSKTSGITSGSSFTLTPSSTYYAVASGGTIKGKATAPSGYTSSGTAAKNNLGQTTTVKISSNTTTKESSEASTSVSAGYVPYTYVLASSLPTSLPTANRSKSKPSSISVSGGDDTTYLYIFVPSSASISTIFSGGFGVPFTLVESSKPYAVNNGKSTTFNVYKTDSTVVKNTFSIA